LAIGIIESTCSENYGLNSGFWPGALGLSACEAREYAVYLPLVLRSP